MVAQLTDNHKTPDGNYRLPDPVAEVTRFDVIMTKPDGTRLREAVTVNSDEARAAGSVLIAFNQRMPVMLRAFNDWSPI